MRRKFKFQMCVWVVAQIPQRLKSTFFEEKNSSLRLNFCSAKMDFFLVLAHCGTASGVAFKLPVHYRQKKIKKWQIFLIKNHAFELEAMFFEAGKLPGYSHNDPEHFGKLEFAHCFSCRSVDHLCTSNTVQCHISVALCDLLRKVSP